MMTLPLETQPENGNEPPSDIEENTCCCCGSEFQRYLYSGRYTYNVTLHIMYVLCRAVELGNYIENYYLNKTNYSGIIYSGCRLGGQVEI